MSIYKAPEYDTAKHKIVPLSSIKYLLIGGIYLNPINRNFYFPFSTHLGWQLRRYRINKEGMVLHRYGMDDRTTPKPEGMFNKLRMRVTNNRLISTIHTSTYAGNTWVKYAVHMEVSGYNHNVAYGFMSLRPAIYAVGKGKTRVSNLVYRALPRFNHWLIPTRSRAKRLALFYSL